MKNFFEKHFTISKNSWSTTVKTSFIIGIVIGLVLGVIIFVVL